MRHSNPAFENVLAVVALSALLLVPATGAAQTVVPLESFRGVSLSSGGKIVIRHGSTPRVTLLKGNTECTSLKVVDGELLVIDRRHADCPERYRLEIEVLVPSLHELRVADGGSIQTRGSFPHQSDIRVSVESGGAIDLRSLTVDQVNASVRNGGMIFTRPGETLAATVHSGGAVTYWGKPRNVKRSVVDGGVVARGAAADADKPLDQLGPGTHDLPPIPPIPPIPPSGGVE